MDGSLSFVLLRQQMRISMTIKSYLHRTACAHEQGWVGGGGGGGGEGGHCF